MKTRKVISAILAGACALSAMSFTATAADKTIKTAGSTTFKVAAATATPEVNVSIPGSVAAVINPYGTAVTIKGTVYGADGVTSPVYTIRNFTTSSDVEVKVKATITPASTDIKVSASKTPAAGKNIYAAVYGAADATAVDYYKVEKGEGEDAADVKTAFGNEKADDALLTAGALEKAIAFAEKEPSEATSLMKLPAATLTENSDPKKPTYETYGYGKFQITGAVGAADWGPKDKVTLNLVLQIGPCAAAK